MGALDNGDQKLRYDYKNEAKSESFNTIHYKTRISGIYSGGVLSKINDTEIEISPLIMHIEDISTEVGVRVETTVNAVVDTVSPTDVYIIARMSWLNVEDNYADFIAVDYASITSGDLIIGKCIFDGATLDSFDYSRKNTCSLSDLDNDKDNLKVYASEPIAKTVTIESGVALINNTLINYAGGNSTNLGDTTLGRTDLICLNDSGTIDIIEGVDSGSPVTPAYPSNKLVLAEVSRDATRTDVIGTDIILVNKIFTNSNFNKSRVISSLATTFVINEDVPEDIFLCDLSSNALLITLPDAIINKDRILTFPFVNASNSRTLSFDTVSSQTINGVTPDNYQGYSSGNIQVLSDGSNYQLFIYENNSAIPISSIVYDTGWIDPASWDNQQFIANHNFDEIDISKFDITFYYSSDGTEANSIKVEDGGSHRPADTDTDSHGIIIKANDTDNITVQTGDGGFQILDGSGVRNVINDTDAGSYKIVVRYPQYLTQVHIPQNYTYNLSGGSAVHPLPDAVTYIGEISVFWENGILDVDELTFTTISSQTIDGYLPSVWIGSGKGLITLVSLNGHWKLKEYEDVITETTEGFKTIKYRSGKMEKRLDGKTINATDTTLTYDLPFTNVNYISGFVWSGEPSIGTPRIFKTKLPGATYKLVGSITGNSLNTTNSASLAGIFDILLTGDWK